MIFPPEIRDYHNTTQPAKENLTKNKRAQVKTWFKFARRVKAKQHKTRAGSLCSLCKKVVKSGSFLTDC
jgi:hypothetical protein